MLWGLIILIISGFILIEYFEIIAFISILFVILWIWSYST